MPSFKDTFNDLKIKVFGTKTVDIDTKLNQAVKDISSYRSGSGRQGYIDLVRNMISKTAGGDMSLDNAGGIFGQGATSPSTFGQGNRLARYKSYEAIVQNINYCHRALAVITDNVLAPDDITKVSLDIKPSTLLGTEEVPVQSQISTVKEGLKILKLEENLDIITKNTLLLGDFFVEIANAKTALTSKSLLAEQFQQELEQQDKEKIQVSDNNLKYNILMDYTSLSEANDTSKDDASEITSKPDQKIQVDKARNMQLVFHDPARVIKLQSDMFPLCFGYLVFPKATVNPQQIMQTQVVDSICTSILKSLEKRIPQINDVDDKELKGIIAAMVKETDETRAMNIRYVQPERMQHFKVPSMKFHPYGESIFDSCQFIAKVLIALETALAVQRLSRSTEKRKIGIEVGMPRDAQKLVQKLQEEFNKRKISLDSFGTVDTIPSMITTFEDIYIPQKDGKPFVDISSFAEGNVDIRGKVDELKFLRDSVVASLGVPASFLNIEENLSNKNALGEENILFARTIISHQKYITKDVNSLIQKIFTIINPEQAMTLFDNIIITLPPPKSLQFERESKYLSDLTTLIESLERIGIPKEWAKKHYLTNIDWDEVKNHEIEETVDKKLGVGKKDDDGLGGMGGMGGMGGGF